MPKLRVGYRYPRGRSFSTIPGFQLICGLEIHTQLNTQHKLFSKSNNSPFKSVSKPNSQVSYFDMALPGTRPRLNYECVLYAIKLGLSLNSKINLESQFDRKHYFYGDQPLGYQITQHYSPIAKEGSLSLSKEIDGIDEDEKSINIIQLQLEQDTGMSHYNNQKTKTFIDLNRSNVPLIELVTKPDFTSVKQVRAFIKKYQDLVRELNICTGNLETGAIRVDVNVSVNQYPRIELKNLPNTSSIINAIKYEYERQINIIKNGSADKYLSSQETREWNSKETVKLRSKETTIDYRYMPDSEIPIVTLDPGIITDVKRILPIGRDEKIQELKNEPYNLSTKDAKLLSIHNESNDLYTSEQIRQYFLKTLNTFKTFSSDKKLKSLHSKLTCNWILHELLGNLNKLKLPISKVKCILTPEKFNEFLNLLACNTITNSSGKLLLSHILVMIRDNDLKTRDEIKFKEYIREFNLETIAKIDQSQLIEECTAIINELNNPTLIEGIQSGKKKNSINVLVGLGMRKFQGRIRANELKNTFEKILQIK